MPVLNPGWYCYHPVWANPLSLATTYGISFDFYSCWYLDVSVPNVCPRYTIYSCNDDRVFNSAGFPHSDICGSMAICASPQLFAACHVLHRLLVPRHSPYALSSLTSKMSICFALLCQTSFPALLIYKHKLRCSELVFLVLLVSIHFIYRFSSISSVLLKWLS